MQQFCTFVFSAQSHDFHFIYGCYESEDVRVDVVVDGDVVAYADFNKKEVVWAIPHLPQPAKDIQKKAYDIARASTAHCHSVLRKAETADPGAPPRQGTDLGTLHCFQTFICLTLIFETGPERTLLIQLKADVTRKNEESACWV